MFALRIAVVIVATQATQGVAWSQMIVAHRGASYDAPENTLAAFKLAWEQGSDGIEGDFYLTSDEEIVCIHDKDTERTAAGPNLIVEHSTLAQLRELEYGSWKGSAFKGQPIPTLEQVFETVPPGKTFVIELKSKSAIVPVLAKKLSKLPTESIKLLIITFDQETARACKGAMPSTRVHWLTSFKNDDQARPRPTADQVARTVRQVGADGVGMKGDRNVIDDAFITELKAGGCNEFHVWTVDEADDAAYFQRLGALGITTNRPGFIGSAIRN